MIKYYNVNQKGALDLKVFRASVAKFIRDNAKNMPEGREKAIFMTKMEEASFFGTKAIASDKRNHATVDDY